MASPSSQDSAPVIGWTARIAVAAMAVLIALVGCELAARLMYPTPPMPGREPQLRFRSDPNVGFIHVPDQQGYLDDGLATINALGLRGPLPEIPKPEGQLRILVVGDSMMFGWGVNDDQTFVVQLEQQLRQGFPGRRLDVINGGVSAYDLKHDARFLRHFAPMLQPDIVLVGLYWNDLPYESLSPDDRPPFRLEVAGPAGTSEASANDQAQGTFRLANAPSRLNRLLRSSRALYVLRHAWLAAIAPTDAATNLVQWEMALLQGTQSPAVDAAWLDIQQTLEEIRALAEGDRYQVGVVMPPIRAQVEEDHPSAAYQSRVRLMAEALGMFVVDPLPRFRAESEPGRLFIPFDRMHLTGAGNEIMARATFEVLKSRHPFIESTQ
jgi:lysophospholipase L1-like esterase